MTDLAVIRATFSDWRTVKGRKQLQLIFEVPIEQQKEVLTRLGAPNPSDPLGCAIALIDLSSPPKAVANAERSEKGKERYRESDKMQQAATRAVMMCKDGEFRMWASMEYPRQWQGAMERSDGTAENIAAIWLRWRLNLESRSEIANNERAYNTFLALENSYKQAIGQIR